MFKANFTQIEIVELAVLTISRKTFLSRSDALNHYFHQVVSQDEKRNLTKCFVLTKAEHIVGYYTLSASAIKVSDIPCERIKHNAVRYPYIPAVLIGRLAIDQAFERQGYGKFLIADAIHRVKQSELGVAVLVVEAKDENATAFYQQLGFIPFNEWQGRKLFYPLTHLIK